MSRVLLPLVPFYAAAVGAKNLAYDRGRVTQHRLNNPVISIGNLSTGGSGKTPLTIRLGELLREQGIAVDVLSRGYGRQSTRVQRVDPEGRAEEYGDEPLLIARSANIPVYVGPDRYAAGLLAESESPAPRLHLLDDGFQHRRLARDLDLVVLHSTDFATHLLPAGRLREPIASLSRAQILVLREEDHGLEPQLRARGFHQPIWWMSRRLDLPSCDRVIAFCAIARPDEFLSGLCARGVLVAAARAWRDHHRCSQRDIADLVELQRQHQAGAFLTTEKDLARLTPEQRHSLENAAPLHAAKLIVRLVDEPAAVARILALQPALPRP
jgi:tetraacyldisaccharide 4'-kinase